ncbi:hypothetical protein [Campylobacter devanensis]|uniref:hypothetical protein n=1 Tax=Campylobacter devanensis TaxID=3161138 RepID=UPI000A351A33|nr:hypothetical protein [Campylobacter sp. P0222]
MANLDLDTSKLVDDYKQIEATIISENSIFDKTIKYLESSFNDKSLAPKDKITIQSNLMSSMAVNLTAKALEIALNLQQTKNQLELANGELELKKEQTKNQIELSKQELALKQQQTNSQIELAKAEIEQTKNQIELSKAELELKSNQTKSQIELANSQIEQTKNQIELSKQELALKQQQTNSQIELANKELELKKEQTKSQIELAKAEIEFNKARTALVTAQTTTETQKKNAVIREIASYDDQQRIKEAEIITNAVFGYASGGVAVPGELSSKMLDLIDKITPNS